ncbi:hypothetical protein PoB_001603100 [Plakobranchus ocellatus]|uniref:Uncharacterized protein n=1 Tax=Plakobranchus ocellatus TaxID=259542 RepID=A0AAV3YQV4_9GAST|nr:hypothetical protein PoB_001603100 [Plakobranchus ocellatus]
MRTNDIHILDQYAKWLVRRDRDIVRHCRVRTVRCLGRQTEETAEEKEQTAREALSMTGEERVKTYWNLQIRLEGFSGRVDRESALKPAAMIPPLDLTIPRRLDTRLSALTPGPSLASIFMPATPLGVREINFTQAYRFDLTNGRWSALPGQE